MQPTEGRLERSRSSPHSSVGLDRQFRIVGDIGIGRTPRFRVKEIARKKFFERRTRPRSSSDFIDPGFFMLLLSVAVPTLCAHASHRSAAVGQQAPRRSRSWHRPRRDKAPLRRFPRVANALQCVQPFHETARLGRPPRQVREIGGRVGAAGSSAFTRMPRAPSSTAQRCTSPISPALLAA